MNGLVSVVITTHAREVNILKMAIDSVLNQSYKNIELIVVNDAPDYAYRNQIDTLIEGYGSNVQYIMNCKGGGANVSRNMGAEISKGEYLSFLDDDDYWHSGRVESVVKHMKEIYAIAYHDIVIFNENMERRLNRSFIPKTKLLESILYSNDWGGFSSVTVRRDAFFEVGGLDPKVKSQQDTDLWIRLAQNYSAVYISEALTYYRLSDDAISANEQKKLDGLYYLMKKYHNLYDNYPESLNRKLRDELVLFEKNGWTKGAEQIYKDLSNRKGKVYALKAKFTGLLKRIASIITKR